MTLYQRRPVVADAARYDGSSESLDAIEAAVSRSRFDRWTSRVLVDRNGETSWARLKEGQWVLAVGESVEVMEAEQFAAEFVELDDAAPVEALPEPRPDAPLLGLVDAASRINYLEALLGREVSTLSDLTAIFGIPVDHPDAEAEVMRSLACMVMPWESPGGIQPLDPCFIATSLRRSARWHGSVDTWSLEDWLCALGGELGEAMGAALRSGDGFAADEAPRSVWLCAMGEHLGEAMNLSKKLRRLEDGLKTDGRDDDLEEGDYAAMIGMHLVEVQAIASRFIGSLGFVPRFPVNRIPPQHGSSVGEELADVLLYLPMVLASAGVLEGFNATVVHKFDEVSVRYGFPERMGVAR